jgi:hypothetical protein
VGTRDDLGPVEGGNQTLSMGYRRGEGSSQPSTSSPHLSIGRNSNLKTSQPKIEIIFKDLYSPTVNTLRQHTKIVLNSLNISWEANFLLTTHLKKILVVPMTSIPELADILQKYSCQLNKFGSVGSNICYGNMAVTVLVT